MHKNALLLWTLFLITGCERGINFDPQFKVGDFSTESIVGRDGVRVYSYEPAFNDYACMHKDKVAELAEILTRARIPQRKIMAKYPDFL
jgi:hypothetical protein